MRQIICEDMYCQHVLLVAYSIKSSKWHINFNIAWYGTIKPKCMEYIKKFKLGVIAAGYYDLF